MLLIQRLDYTSTTEPPVRHIRTIISSDQSKKNKEEDFKKLLEAEANRRVRMYNLQSAKDYASVRTSLAIVQPVHKR